MNFKQTTFEQIHPPDYTDKSQPDCPECREKMFYVGVRSELREGKVMACKLYQCGACRRLFKEVRNAK